jgi:membrane-bound serine protease (ClpP class)
VLVAVTLGRVSGSADEPQPEPRKYQRAVLIRFEGEINPLLEQNFYRKLAVARRHQPDLLVVEIDSPGGWVESSLNLADRLRQISWARTVAFVPREAISGGAVMALGCDDIVMAAEAHLGDAGEIFLDERGMFRYVEEKARSYLASRLRVLAEAKGRSPALAEAMCDMNLAVFHVRNKETGVEAFMSEQELASAHNADHWEKLKPVFGTREKHFLTVNGREAIQLKLAQHLAADRTELRRTYGLAEDFIVLEHTAVDTAVMILNAPLITGLLIVVALISIYIEFSMPGTFVGGLIGGLCLALFFWSRFLGGTAGWLELILFAAGLIFLGMEFFVIPGFGIAGISGILMLIASFVMASQTFVVPQTNRELNTTLTQFGIVGISSLIFLIAAALASRYLGAIPIARSLMLELPQSSGAAAAAPVAEVIPARVAAPVAPQVSLGEQGIADSPLRPAGKVRFGENFVDVVSDGMFIDRGRAVRVVEVSGNRIVVREVEA